LSLIKVKSRKRYFRICKSSFLKLLLYPSVQLRKV